MENAAYYSSCLLAALVPLLSYFLLAKFWTSSGDGSRSRHGGRRLHLPPGPWQLPIIGSLHHLRGSSLIHRALRDLSLRHGPLMHLKLGEVHAVVASSPAAAREFMRTHDAVFSSRPMTLMAREFTKDGHGPGIAVAPYGEHWRQLRKVCIVELLSARRVRSFAPVREAAAGRLVHAVAVAAAAEGLVDVGRLVAEYVAGASVRAIVGRRFAETDALLRFVDESVALAGGFTPVDLFPSSRLVRALTLRRAVRRVEEFRDSLFEFMDRVVREHIERKQQQQSSSSSPSPPPSPCEGEEEAHDQEDLVDVLLRIQQEGNLKFPLTMTIIEAVIFDLIAGAIETAASTLEWAMAELMRNPSAMSKAQSEVRRVYAGESRVTEDHRIGELPYLQQVIKETLRLHVPGPLLIPRECQEHRRVLGYDVPAGAMVLVNAWAIARSPEHWEEPDAFRPERFAAGGDGDGRDFRGNDFEFIPFGAGRRICPGMAFGLANLELGLATLLFCFDWSLPEGVAPAEMDMTETLGITARRKAGLLLSATPRVVVPTAELI